MTGSEPQSHESRQREWLQAKAAEWIWQGPDGSWHVRSCTAIRNMRASLGAESRVRLPNRRQTRARPRCCCWTIHRSVVHKAISNIDGSAIKDFLIEKVARPTPSIRPAGPSTSSSNTLARPFHTLLTMAVPSYSTQEESARVRDSVHQYSRLQNSVHSLGRNLSLQPGVGDHVAVVLEGMCRIQ
jgi:hypothetical protein